jgi:hypothetical protein
MSSSWPPARAASRSLPPDLAADLWHEPVTCLERRAREERVAGLVSCMDETPIDAGQVERRCDEQRQQQEREPPSIPRTSSDGTHDKRSEHGNASTLRRDPWAHITVT